MTGSSTPTGLPNIARIAPDTAGIRQLFLDTNPFIYFVEANPNYFDPCRDVFEAIDRGDALGCTSALTLTEVLVHPLRSGDATLAGAYKDLLAALPMPLIAIDEAVAERAADLRARYSGLKTPDAIQLAAALTAGCDGFLTADQGLRRIAEPGMRIFVLQAPEPPT